MYNIGQVLFIISNGTKTIEPIQVHSKQILESWDGTEVQHMCATADNKTISLEKHQEKGLLAGVFETVEEAEALLLQLASEMVSKLAQKAREKATVFSPPSPAEDVSSNDLADTNGSASVPLDLPDLSQTQSIVLEDGTKATVHIPPELS